MEVGGRVPTRRGRTRSLMGLACRGATMGFWCSVKNILDFTLRAVGTHFQILFHKFMKLHQSYCFLSVIAGFNKPYSILLLLCRLHFQHFKILYVIFKSRGDICLVSGDSTWKTTILISTPSGTLVSSCLRKTKKKNKQKKPDRNVHY